MSAPVLAQAQADRQTPSAEPAAGLAQLGGGDSGAKPRGAGVGRGGRAGMEAPGAASDDKAAKDAGAGLTAIKTMPVDVPLAVGPLAVGPQAVPTAKDAAAALASAAIAGPGRQAGRARADAAGLDAAAPPQAAAAAGEGLAQRASPGRVAPGPPAQELPSTAAAADLLTKAADPPAGVTMPASLAGFDPGPAGGPSANARAAGPGSGPAPPAAEASVYPQLAPALVSLAGGPPGTQRLTVRLDPAELGHVQIRIDRAKDAPPEVSITAERPETLALLQRDQHQLHRALDQAGIPTEGRQVTFHSPTPSSDGSGSPQTGQSSWGQSSGQPFSAGADAGGSAPGGSGRGQPGWPRQSDAGGNAPADDISAPAGFGWMRAGLDITA